jgi:hypothetical protein
MGHDSQTVPVTVTVHLPPHHPGHPGNPLPFTGAPVEALTVAGLLLGLTGAAIVTAFRRKPTTSRSPA